MMLNLHVPKLPTRKVLRAEVGEGSVEGECGCPPKQGEAEPTANVAVACCMLFPPLLVVWQIERKCCLTNRRQRLKRLGWRL